MLRFLRLAARVTAVLFVVTSAQVASAQGASAQASKRIDEDARVIETMAKNKERGIATLSSHIEMFCDPVAGFIKEIAKEPIDRSDLAGIPPQFRQMLSGCGKLDHGPSSFILGLVALSGAWSYFSEEEAARAFETAGRAGDLEASTLAVMVRADPKFGVFNDELMLEQIALLEKAGRPVSEIRIATQNLGDLRRQLKSLCSERKGLESKITEIETELARIRRQSGQSAGNVTMLAGADRKSTAEICSTIVPGSKPSLGKDGNAAIGAAGSSARTTPSSAEAYSAVTREPGPVRPVVLDTRFESSVASYGDITIFDVPLGVVPRIVFDPASTKYSYVRIVRDNAGGPQNIGQLSHVGFLWPAVFESNDVPELRALSKELPSETRVLTCWYQGARGGYYWLRSSAVPPQSVRTRYAKWIIGVADACPASAG
jgi:hypothetical protein